MELMTSCRAGSHSWHRDRGSLCGANDVQSGGGGVVTADIETWAGYGGVTGSNQVPT